MASACDYRGFEFKLMEKCYSENSQRYAKGRVLRFSHTFDLIKSVVPKGESKLNVLDIGPFLPFTLACKETLEDLFDKKITVSIIELPSDKESPYISEIQAVFVNIEQESPDLNPNSFDLVLMLEILEHFTQDPFYALRQAHRLLSEKGFLILSTPNVASLRKRLKLGAGRNIYDLYSEEGLYGRHNREYNLTEVKELLRNSGFEVIRCYSKVFRPYKSKESIYKRALRISYNLSVNFLIKTGLNMGGYIFCIARKTEKESEFPEWLYRSSGGLQSMFK